VVGKIKKYSGNFLENNLGIIAMRTLISGSIGPYISREFRVFCGVFLEILKDF
jgi:hypothetical protein